MEIHLEAKGATQSQVIPLWQLLHRCFPTKEFLHKRNITQESACIRCGECPLAQEGWAILEEWLSISVSKVKSFDL